MNAAASARAGAGGSRDRYPLAFASPARCGFDWGLNSVRVLLVEDHKPLLRALRQGLEEEGFAVDIAQDGEEADHKAGSVEYDVIVLDLMLPKIDGITLLKKWRQKGIKTHVLVLTAK